MTPEEQLIQRYFDAFNHHDIEGVMACFHEQPVIVDSEGRRVDGHDAVWRSYETSFALFPFNLLNYALGFTRLSVQTFAVTSFITMAPGASAYAYLGDAGREAV